jgi:trehalose 6-phosphate synthase
MGDEQRAVNYHKLAKYVNKYTSAWWGESFVSELTRISEQAEKKLKVRKLSLMDPANTNGDTPVNGHDHGAEVAAQIKEEENEK